MYISFLILSFNFLYKNRLKKYVYLIFFMKKIWLEIGSVCMYIYIIPEAEAAN